MNIECTHTHTHTHDILQPRLHKNTHQTINMRKEEFSIRLCLFETENLIHHTKTDDSKPRPEVWFYSRSVWRKSSLLNVKPQRDQFNCCFSEGNKTPVLHGFKTCCRLLYKNHNAGKLKCHYWIYIYTIRNKGLQKVLHSEAIEEPSLVPQRSIQSKDMWRNISFLPCYNPKNLLSPQRTFSETERSSDVKGSLDNKVLLLHREAPLF